MNESKTPQINVCVLSSQKGCHLMTKILHNNSYNFLFLNSLEELKQNSSHYLIADETQKIGDLITNSKCHFIVLKDTQKSPASILALSGQLNTFGQNQKQQFVPSYVLDFVVGIGLAIYLLQIKNSSIPNPKNNIQISLIDLAQYYGAFNISAKQNGLLKNPLGKNLLDGGAPFYSLYQCKEGTLAVGNLEPKFYHEMVKGLNLDKQTHQFLMKNQFDIEKWNQIRQTLKEVFITKPASEWQKILSSYDTCVTEVSQKPRHQFKVQPKIYPLTKAKL